jgi:rare lipoprotein A
MLGFKRDGTAAVRVQYVDLAPIEGEDHNLLLASFRAPGAAPAGGEDTQPVMVAYAGERQQAIPALETLDATLIASGTPFDPYRALMAAEASAAAQPVAARAEPTQAVSMGLRSSYSATDRVSAAFDATAALER